MLKAKQKINDTFTHLKTWAASHLERSLSSLDTYFCNLLIKSLMKLCSIFSTDGLTPSVFQGTIAFEDVQFSYPTRRDFPVCQGLSLTVPQGTVLAVVGASGSGKSTLASLLLRLYDPDSGRITVDGIDIRELSAEWLRNNMGVVSQVSIQDLNVGYSFSF